MVCAILSAFVIGSCTLTHATKKDTHYLQCMSSPGVHRHFSTPKFDKEPKKWTPYYPASMKRWFDNWDVISPIFKFSTEVRTVFYTMNAIESLNSSYRRLNCQRSVFPSAQALLKTLYLATFEATKKWTMAIRNWGKVRGELSIMYPNRLIP